MHVDETVLQLTDGIAARRLGQTVAVAALRNVAGLVGQQMERVDGTADGLVTEEQDDQQTDEDGKPHDVEQTVVAAEHIILGTDDGHAPIRLA